MTLSRFKPHLGLLVVLPLYFVIVSFASWHAPLAAGPDEVAHFMFARFLRQEKFLPFTAEDRQAAGYKSDHPPLYAALVAGLFFGDDLATPPFVKLTQGIPRRHLVVGAGVNEVDVNSPQVIETEDPLAGELLFWRFGRLLSTIFSGATLVVIYLIALQTFADLPQKNLWALAAVLSVAFIPTFIFISGVFSYESLLGLWLSLYLLVAVYIIKKTDPGWLYLLAGLFVGLAMVTKLSALPALLSLLVFILMVGYRAGWSKGKYLTRLALSGLGVLLGAGWWFVLVELKLNKVAELGWLIGLLHPIIVGDGSDRASLKIVGVLSGQTGGDGLTLPAPTAMLAWAQYIFGTFWSWRLKGPPLLFPLLLVVTGLIFAGLIRLWRQRPESRLWLTFLVFHALLFCLLPLVRFVTTGLIRESGQGHHILFPAVGALAILMTWGLGAWFPACTGRQWLGGMLLGLGLLGWSLSLQVGQVYLPPVPVRTVPPLMPASAQRVELDVGPAVLKGYELKGLVEGRCCDAAQPALGVNLYWLAKEFAVEDYLGTVGLVDSQGQMQSVWVGHAANGRYPTRAWEPGDIVRDEIWLPLVGLEPGVYTINLEIWGANAPVPLANGDSVFNLATIDLSDEVPLLWPDESAKTGNEGVFQVWQEGQIVADSLPVFGSRSTIQITAAEDVEVSLVGPDQRVYAPAKVAGQTHVFVVDPLWATGLYQLQVRPEGQTAWQSAPGLRVNLYQRQTEIPASQTVVKANFADQIMLLGYNLPQRHLLPGEALPIFLHWQALKTLPADFIMFTRLRDEAGQVWGGYDRWPRETYSPFLWVPGEVVEDGFTLEVSPDAPAGLYYLDVGFYLPMGDAAVSLPLVQAGQMSDVTSVTIGSFRVGDTAPAETTLDLPQPEILLNQPFGDAPNLTLLGYDLVDQTAQASPSLKLLLYWRSEAPLSVDYTTFLHVRDAAGEIVAQQNQPMLKETYPTSLWLPGEMITNEIVVPLPPTLPAGEYNLVMGLYDLNTGKRLVVPDHPENSLTLSHIKLNR